MIAVIAPYTFLDSSSGGAAFTAAIMDNCTAKSGETGFHAKRLKEGLVKYTGFIE